VAWPWLSLAVPGVLTRLDAVLLGPGIGLWIGIAAGRLALDEPALEALQTSAGFVGLDAVASNRLAWPERRGRRAPTWLPAAPGTDLARPPMPAELPDSFSDLAGSPARAAAAATGRCQGFRCCSRGSQRGGLTPMVGAASCLGAAAAACPRRTGDVLAGLCGRTGGRCGLAAKGGAPCLAARPWSMPAAWRAAKELGEGAATPRRLPSSWPTSWAGWLSGRSAS